MGYPSKREADRLERWPERIELEDLRECFALGDTDRELVFAQRGGENRLGLAVQLCALRFLGFVPDELAGIPEPARLADQLPAERRGELDRLVEVDPELKVAELVWLRAPTGRVGVKGALAQVAKYERLVELHAGDVDLSSLPPSRRRQLAAQARRLDAQGFQRRDTGPTEGPVRRHPILLVALAELYLERGDELLDLFCRLLAGAQRRANTTVDRERRKTARTRDELVDLATTH